MNELGCSKVPPLNYFLSLATDKHALQDFQDLPPIDIPDVPLTTVPYPEGNNDNIYNDTDLMTKFIAVANPEDILQQKSLHKKTNVEHYDPSIFEKKIGGQNNRYAKSKKHVTSKKKKTKRIKRKTK